MKSQHESRARLLLFINGKKYEPVDVQPETTLLEFIRSVGLTGTKLTCGEMGCGACTVYVARAKPDGGIAHRAVNACLAPLISLDHCSVVTVEGLGSPETILHPLQRRLAEAHGSQCGFCTPGFIMAAYAFLRSNPNPTAEELEEQAGGNLCRCTGYRPILEALRSFAGDGNVVHARARGASSGGGCCGGGGAGGGGCCRDGAGAGAGGGGGGCGSAPSGRGSVDGAAGGEKRASEPIFPPLLRRSEPQDLVVQGEHSSWYRPVTLARLLALRAAHPNSMLVAGNSEIGVQAKLLGTKFPVLIAATHVPELHGVAVRTSDEDGSLTLRIGASTTLTDLRDELRGLEVPNHARRLPAAILRQLQWFASNQVRNVATVGGNLVNASPISDLCPVFLACGAKVILASASPCHPEPYGADPLAGNGGHTRVSRIETFFKGYHKVDLKRGEVVLRVEVPMPRHDREYVSAYKQARRREDDISIVCAAMRVSLSEDMTVEDAAFAYGGMAAVPVLAGKTRAAVLGRRWDEETLSLAMKTLQEDLPLAKNAPGGQVEYRRALTASFLKKFFVETRARFAGATDDDFASAEAIAPHIAAAGLDAKLATSVVVAHRPASSGVQDMGDAMLDCEAAGGASATGSAKVNGHVHEPVRHVSALEQASGTAEYTDDIPRPYGTLECYPVLAAHAHAEIRGIDRSVALAMDGVVDVITHEQVVGDNSMGAIFRDEEMLPSRLVTAHAQVIGVVVAETLAQAREAAKHVYVDYLPLEPVLTIDQAIDRGQFFDGFDHTIERRDASGKSVDDALAACEKVIEGELRVGGQEHFYLEPNTTLAVPGEAGQMTIHTSTQNPTKTQNFVASTLGVAASRVVCKCKRLGGGFGGKETRSVYLACIAAAAASRTRRPVRFVLDRHIDMAVTGTRHPFLAKYRVGYDSEGRVHALDVNLFANGGCSFDLSGPVVDRALFHSENAYLVPNLRARGRVCKTNIPSNTAFRGFGGPQGMIVAEDWIDRVAHAVGKPPHVVRELNFYKEGDKTHYGQELRGCNLQACWSQLMTSSEFASRSASVAEFNARSRHVKRGIAAVPTKFGMSFTAKFMNQGGALVHIYTDGTVRASHGGVEMGQGLHTKMAQVVATSLGVPITDVHVACTGTDTVANTQPTAASVSADINGAALLDACSQINERLRPVREAIAKEKGEGEPVTMREIATRAYFDRINLSANGFYRTPDIGYDFDKAEGIPFNYFVYGAAVTEVEVDTLTGDHTVLRSDIVMDLGKSLNPALDVGQIEGAFVQGLGLFTLEEIRWTPQGKLFTRGPGTYKIPSSNDVPIDMRVSLLRGTSNPRAIFSSKGVGEPPLHLATSAFFAIKEAIRAARKDAGLSDEVRLHSPATSERIRMACEDDITAKCVTAKDDAPLVKNGEVANPV